MGGKPNKSKLIVNLIWFLNCDNADLFLLILHTNIENMRLTNILIPDTFCPNAKNKNYFLP